jgi:hypothetical protein
MSNASILFLSVRVLHVVLAALWVGATAFASLIVMPAIQESGPAAGPVMAGLMRRRVPMIMATLGGVTALAGIWLYWRFTGGFNPELSHTMAARVFGAGGAAGILAVIIGGAVVSRNVKKAAALAPRAASLPEGPERAAVTAQISAMRRRSIVASRIVLLLQIVAVALMAIGHYV